VHAEQELVESIAMHKLLAHKLEIDLLNFEEHSVKVIGHTEVSAWVCQNEFEAKDDLKNNNGNETEQSLEDAC